MKDGRYYTSAGVTAGIDLALALIEEDYGSEVALRAARERVVYLKRPGGQEQYSEPLRFQVESTEPIAVLGTWLRGHLRHDLSVEALARRASLSPRQFNRGFHRAFNRTPARFVEDLRLSEARERLATTKSAIESVALSVGFASGDADARTSGLIAPPTSRPYAPRMKRILSFEAILLVSRPGVTPQDLVSPEARTAANTGSGQ